MRIDDEDREHVFVRHESALPATEPATDASFPPSEPRPGDILLAEDTTGGGHRWRLTEDQPWWRAYVTVAWAPAAFREPGK